MKMVDERRALAEALRDVVDEQRLAYNWSRILERRRPKPVTAGRLALVVVPALVAVGVIVGLFTLSDPATSEGPEPLFLELSEWTPVIAVPYDAAIQKRVTLSDGSCLTLAPGALLEVRESSAHRFELALLRGWVRFSVTPLKGRTWVVDAGLGRVLVRGTQFTVNRTEESVKVAVHRGAVSLYRQHSGKELARLTAGEFHELLAPDRAVAIRGVGLHPEKREASALSEERTPKRTPSARKGRGQTSSGHGGLDRPASRMFDLAGLGSSDPVNDLLKAVDEARRRNRPSEAARLLTRILKEHPHDPAIGLVALTLGRIRLDALHQPRAAATALKRAIEAEGLPEPLREQALARCVEALRRAGDDASARSMSRLYRQRFPRGVWLPWVARWSGID